MTITRPVVNQLVHGLSLIIVFISLQNTGIGRFISQHPTIFLIIGICGFVFAGTIVNKLFGKSQ